MNQKTRIKASASYAGISESKIADAIGKSQANFSQTAARGSFKDSDMVEIAKALGAKYCVYFEFPDGTRI